MITMAKWIVIIYSGYLFFPRLLIFLGGGTLTFWDWIIAIAAGLCCWILLKASYQKTEKSLGEDYFNFGVDAYKKGDYQKALDCYLKAAEYDFTKAFLNLGAMYLNEQDDSEALFWTQKAVDKGNEIAMINLGVMYERGRAVEQDDSKAAFWYRKAIEGDLDGYDEEALAQAMINLGELYEAGKCVVQDHSEAFMWYSKAVDKGSGRAMIHLGFLYETGAGEAVEQDYSKAAFWYRKAIEGDLDEYDEEALAQAMINLGELYEAGKGVVQDHSEAFMWYSKAVDKGFVYDGSSGWLEWAAENGSDAVKLHIKQKSEQPQPLPSSVSNIEANEKVDLNFASEKEIASLPKVNVILAKKIIQARQHLGGFTSFEQVVKEANLNESTAEAMKDHVRCSKVKIKPQPKPTKGRLIDF